MKYKIGDKVMVQRGFLTVAYEIINIHENSIHPYEVRGWGTTGRTSDEYITGLCGEMEKEVTYEELDKAQEKYCNETVENVGCDSCKYRKYSVCELAWVIDNYNITRK